KGYIKTMNKLCKYSRETHTALRMQAMELKDHPFYIGIQYHAKFGLSPSMPSPPFIGLIQAALHEKEASETIQTISNDSKSEAKVLKKKKDATCKFEYFIKCKDPIENGIFKISSLERFLKAKLQNLVNDVRVERSKIVISSEKKFSKHYLKYLTKKFLKKESLHESIKVISSAKNTFDLCCFSSDKSDDSDDSDED
uniref:Uncharacterized protein n=1 Tax=Panagrolaimus sp. ES5 TaxID=591445 RepID=A0AC34GB41_9BILA